VAPSGVAFASAATGDRMRVRDAAGIVALALIVGYCAGARAASRDAGVTIAALDAELSRNSGELLATYRARDSASAASAAAIALSDSVRGSMAAIRSTIRVTSDTSLAVAVRDSLSGRLDTLFVAVPVPVVQLIRTSDDLARSDSLTIATLLVEVGSLEDVVRLQRERISSLEQKVVAVERRGFWRGVKTGAAVTLAAVAAAVLVAR
jgi:hypothetical protein